MTRTLGVMFVVLSVAAGCADEPIAESPPLTDTTSTTSSTTLTSTAGADDVCDELAGPVEVLNRTTEAFAGTDIDEVSSQEAWDRTISQYEANAAAFTEIGRVVPQLSEAADDAAAASAAHAAAARATEPDLALIDRARTTSRTRVDPVAVVLGRDPTSTEGDAEIFNYVLRVCPDLIGPS